MNPYNPAPMPPPPPGGNIPYQGGTPVRCPYCGGTADTRICPWCGMDLGTVYAQPAYPVYSQPAPERRYIGYPAGQAPQYPQPPAGYPGYPYAPVSPVPRPARKKGRAGLWVGGISLLFIAVCTGAFFLIQAILNSRPSPARPDFGISLPSGTESGYHHPEGVSAEEYARLQEGMTYAMVSGIIGGDGEMLTSGENLDGEVYYTYGWYGEDNSGIAVYITFTNDVVTEIRNEGLTK